MKTLGLYVHFPFCIKKCHYCDFISFEGRNESDFLRYCQGIALEIKGYGEALKEYCIDTIFFGGGTPSLIHQKGLDIVIDSIHNSFNLSKNIEFTIESNPKTLNREKLRGYLQSGINRLSIGVQTLDDCHLKALGRIHIADDFYRNYLEARDAGFLNINTDIMFSIPKQNMLHWKETVKGILNLSPEHISFYSLKIEEKTPFYEMLEKGKLIENNEDEDRNMYWYAANELKKDGYIHYEISNASKEGYQCRHNMKYWMMKDYLGIGVGAHSYIKGTRISNETDLNKYIQNANNNISQQVWLYKNHQNDEISEYIFTRLRLIEGMDLAEFKSKFGINFEQLFERELEPLMKDKWLKVQKGKVSLTQEGLDISNHIMSKFIL